MWWPAALVQAIASKDQRALHALYERTHQIVFTLIMRITGHRTTAEEVSLDVFHGVWRRASTYDPANAPVLGWIMNQARRSAVDRLRLQPRKTHRPLIDSFVDWPTDVLRPSAKLRKRLARRIATETDGETVVPPPQRWDEPDWNQIAPGISCKLLATDTERDRVSMLVRLAPLAPIRLTAMPASRSCICSTGNCG